MNIKNESLSIQQTYTLSDFNRLQGSKEIVVATVIKYMPDDGLLLDMGSGIFGKLPFTLFEDTDKISKSALSSKVGKNILAYVDSVVDSTVYLNRSSLQKDYKSDVLSTLVPGSVFDTTVVSLAPFGLFVDMGAGVLGLLPIGDVSIARFFNIKDIFSVGSPIKVVYVGESSDGYVVSHKELLGTWEENLTDFRVGDVCQGIIREIKSYGAFIELSPNLTGLADLPSDLDLHIGDSVCVLLKSVNYEKIKVKLQVVSVSEKPYRVRYNYKPTASVLSSWFYTPIESDKQIKRIF